MRPSFLAHCLNGLLLTAAIVYLYWYWDTIKPKHLILFILLLSIAVGVHGISHHYEEIYYGFNPLKQQWQIRDEIICRKC
jgi:hypothetical protein